MLKLTPSRIRDYQTCPLRFKLHHLDAARVAAENPTPALAFGSSMHAALEELHRPGEQHTSATTPETLLRRTWQSTGYATPAQEASYFATGIQLLTRYCQVMGIPKGKILDTELFLSQVVTLGGHQFELAGKLDRVELLPDGVLEILDYKTGSSGEAPRPDKLAVDLPTFVYYLLARAMYADHPHVIVSQLNLRTLKKTEVDYEAEHLAANRNALHRLVQEIAEGLFNPRPNFSCTWCAVRPQCPAFNRVIDLDSLIAL